VNPELDTGPTAARVPIPDGLQTRALVLGKWMRIVGIFQAVASGLAIVFIGIGALSMVTSGLGFTIAMLIVVLLLGVLALCFRQALLLQSAAEHLVDLSSEPEDAHDHLSLAFSRLRHVFVIDAVVAVLLVLRNATEVMFG
jgi:hypothetical protein